MCNRACKDHHQDCKALKLSKSFKKFQVKGISSQVKPPACLASCADLSTKRSVWMVVQIPKTRGIKPLIK